MIRSTLFASTNTNELSSPFRFLRVISINRFYLNISGNRKVWQPLTCTKIRFLTLRESTGLLTSESQFLLRQQEPSPIQYSARGWLFQHGWLGSHCSSRGFSASTCHTVAFDFPFMLEEDVPCFIFRTSLWPERGNELVPTIFQHLFRLQEESPVSYSICRAGLNMASVWPPSSALTITVDRKL